jgi:hypothetical protein
MSDGRFKLARKPVGFAKGNQPNKRAQLAQPVNRQTIFEKNVRRLRYA